MSKTSFLATLRRLSKPYRADGWVAGGSGLRRRDESGHWAHFWSHWPSSSLESRASIEIRCGTACPYLLAVFNRQRIDRAPGPNFIAVHSLSRQELVDLAENDLESRLGALLEEDLPELVERSSDDSLLRWLTDESRSPRSSELRYAALLGHHLGRDDEVERILERASSAREKEDAAAVARGIDLSYRSDRQRKYPQDWSHVRFVKFLQTAPRNVE